MRVEYKFELDDVEVPCFSVETTEGPGKLFTLTTLILNVISQRDRVDVIFHSPNAADLPKKIESFKAILATGPTAPELVYESGESGSLGSSYYSWLSIRSS
ncbi:MAG: hypothetical protein JRG76_10815 [Deltaproteobacteria bacterium]|jgi:hypothetical protein|nr:hypothetical protein [Deltaproteobacteria bacterium]MBW2414989.1 hypothetical protein [Deltaproteobacteria bacterium]